MHSIDGKRIAAELRAKMHAEIQAMRVSGRPAPGLAVILVGDDPASDVYVRNKVRACAEIGIHSTEHRLPADASQDAVLQLVEQLNNNDAIHGILIQQPLPAHINTKRVTEEIAPHKDADGFHPVSVGRMILGLPGPRPCTPAGVMHMLREIDYSLRGKHAVVVGRSNIVGKPMSAMLLRADATVTTCHRHTQNLGDYTKLADVLVVAVGKPGLITGEMVKPGAVVIDVGINRLDDGRLVGDVDAASVTHAGWLSPVPGGVGPMTIAMLLRNTLRLAQMETQ